MDGAVPAAEYAAYENVYSKFLKMIRATNTTEPWNTPGAAVLDSQTFQQWVESNTKSEFARFNMSMFSLYEAGMDPNAISMLKMLADWSTGQPDEDAEKWLYEGGAGQIPQMMAAQLGDRIELSEPVFRIDQDSSGVTTITENGRYRAGYVIVALPPPLAGAITYDLPSCRARCSTSDPRAGRPMM